MQNQRPDPESFDSKAYGASLKSAIEEAFKDVPLTPAQVDRLQGFGTLLVDKARFVNLTRLTAPAEMAVLHFLDTHFLSRGFNPPGPTVCDIGSGAGVPGIPLAVFRPELKITLIDGTAKKMRFARETIKALKIENIRALHARAEEHLRSNSYDAGVVRAAVKPGRLFEILADCGYPLESVVFMLGGDGPRIIKKIKSRSYSLASLKDYGLPGQNRKRYLATFIRPRRRHPRTRGTRARA